ncbi:MAG: universal stress protein [Marinoscillum sp.]|uniref:universal stress protein n=1 Tax=Marinoscillum sp. TaxID=2024838 RepID=UPI003304F4F2
MNLFHQILIPTDFSQAAWHAVQLGLQLIAPENSRLTLLHVFPSGPLDKNRDIRLMEGLRKQMDDFCLTLERSQKTKIQPVILGGEVRGEVLRFIQENAFDLIILGVNSNGVDNEPGSHIANIITQANAPVMVMPNVTPQTHEVS